VAYAAVLDADVLHPAVASDLILRLVERGLFRAVWSPHILDELRRSLVRRGVDPVRVERRIRAMTDAFEEAMVEDVEPFLPAVPEAVDEGDRHVVAAALAARADGIVTRNVRHFPAEPIEALGIEVQELDEFLVNQWTLDPDAVIDVLRAMEEDRARPPRTVPEILQALEPLASGFAGLVRDQLRGLEL
jgi:predicted nucleic acid-binding protein